MSSLRGISQVVVTEDNVRILKVVPVTLAVAALLFGPPATGAEPAPEPREVAERTRAEEAKKWLAANAHVLKTVEAGTGLKDLQPLKKIVGPARVVSLGEATH